MKTLITGADLAHRIGTTSNTDTDRIAAAASDLVCMYVTPDALADPAAANALTTAALRIAVDQWQAETAAGGQPVGLDYQPSPYRGGRHLIDQVSGLIGPWLLPEVG